MHQTEKTIAQHLLQIKAIKLDSASSFRWASGWDSPIYCDSRKILSYPVVRNLVRDAFCEKIRKVFPEVQAIAGVATGAIAHGALVADRLELPFVYVRSSAKEHGLGNIIEGEVSHCKNFVVIEDLISTGNSSLKAVNALREKGCEVIGLAAIFSYNFSRAEENFRRANCRYFTLTNYNHLMDLALENEMFTSSQIKVLRQWQEDPAGWKPPHKYGNDQS